MLFFFGITTVNRYGTKTQNFASYLYPLRSHASCISQVQTDRYALGSSEIYDGSEIYKVLDLLKFIAANSDVVLITRWIFMCVIQGANLYPTKNITNISVVLSKNVSDNSYHRYTIHTSWPSLSRTDGKTPKFSQVTFNSFNGLMAHSPKLIFQFQKYARVCGDRGRIWLMSNDSRFLFGQKVCHNYAEM